MASARDAFSSLDDDVLTIICERVGPDGMFDVSCLAPIEPAELLAAQATLHGLALVSKRLSGVATAVAGSHVGAVLIRFA